MVFERKRCITILGHVCKPELNNKWIQNNMFLRHELNDINLLEEYLSDKLNWFNSWERRMTHELNRFKTLLCESIRRKWSRVTPKSARRPPYHSTSGTLANQHSPGHSTPSPGHPLVLAACVFLENRVLLRKNIKNGFQNLPENVYIFTKGTYVKDHITC